MSYIEKTKSPSTNMKKLENKHKLYEPDQILIHYCSE